MIRGLFSIVLFSFLLSSLFSQPTTIATGQSTEERLRMPWNKLITVGRAYDLFRADLLSQLEILQSEFGYKYIRFHALFDDDMAVVSRNKAGELYFQWHQIDKVYDALLKLNLKPFVELNPMPSAMASGSQTIFEYGMNVTPPKDYDEWDQLIAAYMKHIIERYGKEEVSTWYFELWNEPNLSGFWSGTKEEYFKMYDITAKRIKHFGNDFKVGGPATSKGEWVEDFIHHCYTNNIPADFVSTHLYSQDEFVIYPDNNSPYPPGDFFPAIVRNVQEIVASSSLPELEIHWTEWNTLSAPNAQSISWSKNKYVDNLYAASFIVRNCLLLDKAAHSLGYWVASDIFNESGFKHLPFNFHYGLFNIHGVPKASFNGFRFLNKMRGNILEVSMDGDIPIGCGSFATREFDKTTILIWNHLPVQISERAPWEVEVKIPIDKKENYIITRALIREGAGSPWETWKMMGSPVNLSPLQMETLHKHSLPEYSVIRSDLLNTNTVNIKLRSNEVTLLEISPVEQGFGTEFKMTDEMMEWEKSMGEKSR